jgi:hypothetical protein
LLSREELQLGFRIIFHLRERLLIVLYGEAKTLHRKGLVIICFPTQGDDAAMEKQ